MAIKMMPNDSKEPKFKSFNDTFKYCAFALACGFIYPNRTNVRNRAILYTLLLMFNGFTLFWFLSYTIKCLWALDIINSARNITLGIVVVLYLLKTYYAIWKTNLFADLLEQITIDLLQGNEMNQGYQKIYEDFINRGKFGQLSYLALPALLSSQFPIYAAGGLIYGSMKSDEFKKYMIHDMDLMYIEDKQYTSPYFEIIFAYFMVPCFIIVPNFAGFDGSYCIATSHLCLKLKIMTHKVQMAFKHSKTRKELLVRVKEAAKDHQKALEFYDLIQNLYGTWLLAVFMLTSFLISFNLYQIYLTGVDPKYTIFALTGVFHMYMPCYFASCLLKVGDEISTDIYCADWESWADPGVTKILIFMIARSQKKLLLTGLGIVTFNMDLFISLMQSSYSFFTLITRKEK